MTMTTTRREFLIGATAATAAAPVLAATDAASTAGGLPAWANAQIDAAVARYLAWKGADETVAFTFMTDIHSWCATRPEKPDFTNSRYHVLFAQAAADRAGCDFLVDGGDSDFELECKSDEVSFARMAIAESVYRDYAARPVLFCLGNHDHGPLLKRKRPPISSARFGETFNGIAERHGFKLSFGANKSWGYYDVPEKKFRAIFCNSSDGAYYGYSPEQVAFVAAALDALPEGWTSMAFCHLCPFLEIGHWRRSQYRKEIPGRADFVRTLETFAKARPKALAGCFCGDSHFDAELEWHDVNWTVSQGYGGIGRRDRPYGVRVTPPFSRSKKMLFELVGVKPSVGEFRVFRAGAGGEACDRVCDYGCVGI